MAIAGPGHQKELSLYKLVFVTGLLLKPEVLSKTQTPLDRT
jgi:hypothetical protein